MLKVYQSDGVGTAMHADAWAPMNALPAAANAVDASGDQVVYVAGNSGTMYRSANAGTSWTTYAMAATGVSQSLNDVVAVSPSVAWAVGNAGNITKTSNGGTGWTAQTTGAVNLLGVDAIDATRAWAVGVGGVVLATTNGTSWSAQTSNTAQTLVEVDAVSSQVAWATGNAGVVIRTVDGGANWAVKTAPSGPNTRSILAIDANVALVGSSDGKVWRTTNGGTSWSAVLDLNGAITNAHDLAGTADGSVIWVIGDQLSSGNQVVQRSLDAGLTWTNMSFPASLSSRAVAIGDATTAYIVTSGTVGFRTPASSIPDYSAGVSWAAGGPSFFGACLSSATLGASTGATTWTPSAGCPSSDGAWWKPIVTTSGTAGAKVAEALAPDDDLLPDATLRMRFVFHPASSVPVGTYSAPLVFETVAPNAPS
jgi:photosystem II stability/assembly factor-like uncharacterized protein